MKKLAFAVLATVLFFAACKKDEDKSTPAVTGGSFSFNDTTAIVNNGYLYKYGVNEGYSLAFADSVLTDTLKGKVSALSIDLDTLISGQTYTYLSDDSASYDKTKNFNDATVFYKYQWEDTNLDPASGRFFDGITSGTLTCTKNGDNYSITYTLVYPTGKVTGMYNGKLELRNQQ
ncbi:hypothetical protein GO495_16060 [Chitinophaga oryziterrae]|uniref:Uncharacterized protein n=1 Tax=Chitinophaga oryziterrae TaxID=1031224 RepID=A0A6N8JA34_9BACT|nr:hypothetical protein [Chitinophaga oryziterrae]MVT42107.1 hypothetical protein [Chitinophaga oryziterrae]